MNLRLRNVRSSILILAAFSQELRKSSNWLVAAAKPDLLWLEKPPIYESPPLSQSDNLPNILGTDQLDPSPYRAYTPAAPTPARIGRDSTLGAKTLTRLNLLLISFLAFFKK